jgi:hypothetical protein
MTRTQTRAYGVVTPSTRQPLLEAMLRVFAWPVSNVASLFGLTINRNTRDWHTDATGEALTRKTSGSPFKEADQAETTGLPIGSGPLAAFPSQAGIQSVRIARSSGTLLLSFWAKACSALGPGPRGCVHECQRLWLLPSCSPPLSAPAGMTPLMRAI